MKIKGSIYTCGRIHPHGARRYRVFANVVKNTWRTRGRCSQHLQPDNHAQHYRTSTTPRKQGKARPEIFTRISTLLNDAHMRSYVAEIAVTATSLGQAVVKYEKLEPTVIMKLFSALKMIFHVAVTRCLNPQDRGTA